MGKLYLVRHGRTAWNKGEVFRGTSEVPLDDVGREQARLVGHALRSQVFGPVPVFCSPLSRARETAEIVTLAVTGLAYPTVDARFTDIDVGEWTGLSLAEVNSRYHQLNEQWVESPHQVRFPGGQTLEEVQHAAWSGVLSLVPMLATQDVILVSHRLTLKTIILRAMGSGLENFWRIRLDTASISILEIGSYGSKPVLTLSRLNDVSHLAPLRLPDRIDF